MSNAHLPCTPQMHISSAHLKRTCQTYMSSAHLKCTSQVHISNAHLKCTPQVHISSAHLKCTPQVHISSAHLKHTSMQPRFITSSLQQQLLKSLRNTFERMCSYHGYTKPQSIAISQTHIPNAGPVPCELHPRPQSPPISSSNSIQMHSING
jgi:hypothetical protein